MAGDRITREALYELVWSEPMVKVAAKLGVSGSYLTRVCDTIRVPRPDRGYWAKLEHGKAVQRKALPPAQTADIVDWTRGEGLPTLTEVGSIPRLDERAARRRSGREHPIVVGARFHFENTRTVDEDGLLRPYKRVLPDIVVSLNALPKAISFASALYSALEAAGCPVRLLKGGYEVQRPQPNLFEVKRKDDTRAGSYRSIWQPDRSTVAFVGSAQMGLTVVELLRETTMRYVGGKYVPDSPAMQRQAERYGSSGTWTSKRDTACGRFQLTAYSTYRGCDWGKCWQDSDGKKLVEAIPDIVREIVSCEMEVTEMVAATKRERERQRREYEEKQRRWAIEHEREEVRKARSLSLVKLDGVIAAWARTRNVSAFLDEVERAADRLEPEAQRAVGERLARARKLLDSLDPMPLFLGWNTPEETFQPKLLSADEVAELERLAVTTTGEADGGQD